MLPRSLAGCCQFEVEGETWLLGSRSATRLAGSNYASAVLLDPRRLRRLIDRLLSSAEGRRLALGLLHGQPFDLQGRLESAIDRGALVLLRDTPAPAKVDALPGIATPPEPFVPPIVAPIEDFEPSNKSLLISKCPPELAARSGSITITYLLRELAGQPVTLTLRAADDPGEVVLEQALAPAQTRDGAHDFVWDGLIQVGPQQGQRVTPTRSPIRVEIRHDDTYKDHAQFLIVPPRVEVLALGDFNFSTDREVMLPAPSIEAEAEQAGDLADGVALVAGLIAHLGKLGGARKLLVAGHTDGKGSKAHNLGLSERRAQSVQLYCVGDRRAWAAHAHQHAEITDGQEVLRWVGSRFGWPCDPGPIDGDAGPKTQAARASFRARYQHELDESAGSGQAFELADWQAFFGMYELDLAARLGLTREALALARATIVACDPAILACGEHWPNDAIPRAQVCRDDRRVELLVFGPDDLPEPIGGDDPPGKSIYEPGAYRWIPITPGPGPHPLEGPCFELGIAVDDPGLLDPAAKLRLYGGPYDLRLTIGDAPHSAGISSFHFHGIATGVRYAIDYEPAQGGPRTLARELDLDPLIAGLGLGLGSGEVGLTGFVLALPMRREAIDEGPFQVEVW